MVLKFWEELVMYVANVIVNGKFSEFVGNARRALRAMGNFPIHFLHSCLLSCFCS